MHVRWQPVSDPWTARSGAGLLEEVRAWFARYICVTDDADLDVITLWVVHTWLAEECYTTPRLQLDSPVPGAGKTTLLEHFAHLARDPVQIASLSSPALLTRMLDKGIRTLLIDEADRVLNPDKPGVNELLSVLNSGYKRGATRPVLVPTKGGGWDEKLMPTYAPVVIAGNQPQLPDDTRSRSIRVLLMPDVDGEIEESDWEAIEDDARAVRELISLWTDSVREAAKARPELPAGCRSRNRERWGPLARVARCAGGGWPRIVTELIAADLEDQRFEREEELVSVKPAVALLRHIHEAFGEVDKSLPPAVLIERLVSHHPQQWGEMSSYGKRLTPQRLGRMLASNYGIHVTKQGDSNVYELASFRLGFRRMGLPHHRADPLYNSSDSSHSSHSSDGPGGVG